MKLSSDLYLHVVAQVHRYMNLHTYTHSSNKLEILKYKVITSLVTWTLLIPVTKTIFIFYVLGVLLRGDANMPQSYFSNVFTLFHFFLNKYSWDNGSILLAQSWMPRETGLIIL